MKGPIGPSYVGLPPSHAAGAGAGAGVGAPGAEIGEDWSRSGPNNEIMETSKESKPQTRKEPEEDESEDELVIEECETAGATKGPSVVKEPEPAPELPGGSPGYENNNTDEGGKEA